MRVPLLLLLQAALVTSQTAPSWFNESATSVSYSSAVQISRAYCGTSCATTTDSAGNLFGRSFNIIVAVDPPFVIANSDGTFSGYMPQAIQDIALNAGFNYSLSKALNYNDGVFQTVSFRTRECRSVNARVFTPGDQSCHRHVLERLFRRRIEG